MASRAGRNFYFFLGLYCHFLRKKNVVAKNEIKSSQSPLLTHPAAGQETDFFLVWPEGNISVSYFHH